MQPALAVPRLQAAPQPHLQSVLSGSLQRCVSLQVPPPAAVSESSEENWDASESAGASPRPSANGSPAAATAEDDGCAACAWALGSGRDSEGADTREGVRRSQQLQLRMAGGLLFWGCCAWAHLRQVKPGSQGGCILADGSPRYKQLLPPSSPAPLPPLYPLNELQQAANTTPGTPSFHTQKSAKLMT